MQESSKSETRFHSRVGRPSSTHFSPSTRRNLNGSFQGTPASRSTKQNIRGGWAPLLSFEAYCVLLWTSDDAFNTADTMLDSSPSPSRLGRSMSLKRGEIPGAPRGMNGGHTLGELCIVARVHMHTLLVGKRIDVCFAQRERCLMKPG